MSTRATHKVALLWHGDRAARNTATLENNRLRGVAEALLQAGIAAEPAVYADEFAGEVRDQLLKVDGVLVWVNPIEKGCDRSVLDAMLRQVAGAGASIDTASVSAQPPQSATPVCVRHALRGSVEENMPLGEFLVRCEAYFSESGCIIDQAWQERLAEGMVRCYLVQDEVAGFGHQLVNALFPAAPGTAPGEAPQPGPRLYYPPTRPDFQILKTRMEQEWVPAMRQLLAIDSASLPLIWDADFLYGPKTASGEDTYVLCEINVSSVYPFPDSALAPLARETRARLQASKAGG